MKNLVVAALMAGVVVSGCANDVQGPSEVRTSALTAGSFVQRAQLVVSNGTVNSELSLIGISGDTIVVGGPGNNPGPSAPLGPAANVFVKPAGGWNGIQNEQAKLVPSDFQPGDQFGRVAIDGDVIVVGSYEDNVGSNANQGSAYVFVKPPGGWSGTVTQSAKLTASDGAAEDRFGLRVAVTGDVILVGVRVDDAPQIDRGSVYVFVKPAAGWTGNLTQSAKLTAADGLAGDNFGSAIMLRDDTIVVGAFWDDQAVLDTREGSAYVFVKPAAGWSGNLTSNAKLIASDAVPGTFFGTVAAIHGDTIVVGAPQSVEGIVGGAGAAYVFEKPTAGWSGTLTETAKLSAAGGVVGDRFGVSVAFDGDTITVGADSIEIGANTDQGAVYRFDRPPGGWTSAQASGFAFTSTDGASGDQFANQLMMDGATLVAGAAFDDVGADTNQGSAYVFDVDQSPVLTLPGNITAEATSAAGAVVTFSAQANDPDQGPLTATCVPASGSTFPLGTTQVDCTVTDSTSQTATGSFLVTVVDTTPPALTVPGNITVEATGAAGALVTYAASATDLVDGAVTPVCTPASGDQFPIAVTGVTCMATDTRGNTANASFTVTVADTVAPALIVPGDITVEATGPEGAVVAYLATAADVVDGIIGPQCVPAAGATFPLGATSVTCTATDAHGNAAVASFTVAVVDTTPPALVVPGDITVEATGAAGAIVDYAATATDVVDGIIGPQCLPASGAAFPVGVTSVACTATDAHGNAASGGFSVTVVDTTAPVLALPANITAVATGPAGAVVSYTATAADVVDGPVAAVCTPDSGSTFAVGTTTVNCIATDAAGNGAFGSFTVTVEAEPDPDPDPDTVAFASFKVFAQIDLRRRAHDDRFAVEALFTLGAGNDGIDPVAEDVVLTLGAASWTIPADGFHRTRFGAAVFEGVVGTTRLNVAIHTLHGGRFLLLAGGSGAELTGTRNPVSVGFAVGDDAGTATIIAAIH